MKAKGKGERNRNVNEGRPEIYDYENEMVYGVWSRLLVSWLFPKFIAII